MFTVSGVEMVTRTRTEHMSQEDLIRLEGIYTTPHFQFFNIKSGH